MAVDKRPIIQIWDSKTIILIVSFLIIFGSLGAFLGFITGLILDDIKWYYGTLLLFLIAGIAILASMKKTKEDVHKCSEIIKQYDQNEKIKVMVERISSIAGINTPAVLIKCNKIPNAYTCGTPEESYIVIHDSLLSMFDEQEIEGVLAHEISHVKNNDIPTTILATRLGNITSTFSKYLGLGLLITGITMMGVIGSTSSSKNNNGSDVILLVVAVLGVILAAIGAVLCIFYPLAFLVKMAISRDREYEADKGAAELTKNPLALASALNKLQQESYKPDDSESAYVDLMIVNNYIQNNFTDRLMNTHPPIKDRIKRLEWIAKEMGLAGDNAPENIDRHILCGCSNVTDDNPITEKEMNEVWESDEIKKQIYNACNEYYVQLKRIITDNFDDQDINEIKAIIDKTNDPEYSNILSSIYFFGTRRCSQSYKLSKQYRRPDHKMKMDDLYYALSYGMGLDENVDVKKCLFYLERFSQKNQLLIEITYGEKIFYRIDSRRQ